MESQQSLPAPPNRSAQSGRAGPILSLAGGALVLIGSFLPWVTVASGFGSASVSGTEGDGKITLATGALIAILALLEVTNGQRTRGAVIVVALVTGLIGIYDITKVSDALGGVSNEFVHASVGIGLYAVLAGAAVAFVGGISGRPTHPVSGAGQATVPTFMSTGTRYLLGYILDPPSYGIWDREAPGPPFERFPYSEHGKAEATARFNELERTLVPPEGLPDHP